VKIISYNVNGIRAALKKGLLEWLKEENPDIVCLQELKANTGQFDTEEFEKLGYHCIWNPAERKGYSGVALLSKVKPDKIVLGIGKEEFDVEGRFIRADFDGLTQISTYIPSGSMGDIRQDVKMAYLEQLYLAIDELKNTRPNLVISGDYNICHQAIDIHDPIRNAKVSGFLPEERDWFSEFLDNGLVDSFRYSNPDIVKYSWWSYRARAREKNLGWRLDYHIVSEPLSSRISGADILTDVVHSDHCPVLLEISS